MNAPLMHTLEQAAALRKKWQAAEEPSFLGWITFQDPAAAEIEVEWGYDGLIIDTEHSTFDVSALRATLMAFRGTDCVPIVRVGDNDIYLIKQALDLGAGGVLVPLIQDAADAHSAVQFCRYPPIGDRGVSPRRASNYFRDIETYLAQADRSVLLMLQIECVAAYENLDAILKVEEVDCLFIGQVDLAASMNHMWDVRHPEVVAAVEDIIRRCHRAGRAAAIAAFPDPERIKRWLDLGANVIAVGGDVGFMVSGFQAFQAQLKQAGLPFGAHGQT
jgi:4-hydroxy-2-oxoheptanedioate aldolase